MIYDIYSFLYREPQHIGRMKNPDSRYDTYDKAMAHLKNMEVTLNHMTNIFFTFLPSKLLHTFFETVTNKPLRFDEYDVFVRSLDAVVENIWDVTQPDVFFVGAKNTISIEMKIWAKSSLEQVMKYWLLHHLEQKTSWVQKDHHLIFLWKWTFESLWQQKFQSVDALKNAFTSYEIPKVSKKWWVQLHEYHDAIREMVRTMTISYLNYEDFEQFCHSSLPWVTNDYQTTKLLSGMIEELKDRDLI